jgi:hypothetical protein
MNTNDWFVVFLACRGVVALLDDCIVVGRYIHKWVYRRAAKKIIFRVLDSFIGEVLSEKTRKAIFDQLCNQLSAAGLKTSGLNVIFNMIGTVYVAEVTYDGVTYSIAPWSIESGNWMGMGVIESESRTRKG